MSSFRGSPERAQNAPRFAFFVALLVCATTANAQINWIGGFGGDWGTGSNWDPNGQVPTELEDVTINTGRADISSTLVAESRWLVVGDTATGNLRIDSAGSLTSFGATLGNQASSTGNVTVDAASWTNLAGTKVGLGGDATLSIESGATVDSIGRVEVAVASGITASVTVDGSSSELIAQGGVGVGDPNLGSSTATVHVRNNATLSTPFFGDVLVNTGGVVTVDTGGSIVTDLLFVDSGATLNNHSSVSEVSGAFIDELANSGTVAGSGSQSLNFNNTGVLAPTALSLADDTGVYTITGIYTQNTGGELQVDLGGLSNGGGNKNLTTFDWIDVSGNVSLAGDIDVQLTGGFTPALSQEFEIINVAGSLSGTFDNKPEGSVVAVLSGMPLLVSYQGGDGNDVVLYVPSSFEADFDSDGDVDHEDLSQWHGDYGINGSSDADGDGHSTGLDFLIWQQQNGYGVSPLSAVTAVPEPSSMGLALMAASFSVYRRKRG